MGGLLKLASKLFSPLVRVARKAVQSDTGKKIANAVKEQAINSSMNIAKNVVDGKDLKDSIKDEYENVKKRTK